MVVLPFAHNVIIGWYHTAGSQPTAFSVAPPALEGMRDAR
jgi:hypothetical protein